MFSSSTVPWIYQTARFEKQKEKELWYEIEILNL